MYIYLVHSLNICVSIIQTLFHRFSDKTWNFVRGQLSSVDRHYGWAHSLTHNIGTHQVSSSNDKGNKSKCESFTFKYYPELYYQVV